MCSVRRIMRLAWVIQFVALTLSLSAATVRSQKRVPPVRVCSLKAMLFYEDKGTFSGDVSEVDSGPPYVPPAHWNTPMQYENRSSAVLVVVEVTGEALLKPARRLELTARYIPWQKESGELVVSRIVPVSIPMKVGETDKFYAGFWLYETGCNPVRLSARIIGRKEAPPIKRVIKFGCGE